jgi:hypothetical protein
MVVFTAISPDMANTPGIVEACWCVPGRRRLASVAAPVGLYKKARADQSSFLEGQSASIFRPIDDLEEGDHIDSGQVFDRSAEGSPNLALSSGMGLAERWTNSHDCLRPTRCTLSLSLCG